MPLQDGAAGAGGRRPTSLWEGGRGTATLGRSAGYEDRGAGLLHISPLPISGVAFVVLAGRRRLAGSHQLAEIFRGVKFKVGENLTEHAA